MMKKEPELRDWFWLRLLEPDASLDEVEAKIERERVNAHSRGRASGRASAITELRTLAGERADDLKEVAIRCALRSAADQLAGRTIMQPSEVQMSHPDQEMIFSVERMLRKRGYLPVRDAKPAPLMTFEYQRMHHIRWQE